MADEHIIQHAAGTPTSTGWLSRTNLAPSDKLSNAMLNNLALDDRNWGGDVNAGGYRLSNVILDGSGGFSSTTSPINLTAGADGMSIVNLMKDVTHNRWAIVKGSGAETGGNAGSNFRIDRFDDSGNVLSVPFYIIRATGYVGVGGLSNPVTSLVTKGASADFNSYGIMGVTTGVGAAGDEYIGFGIIDGQYAWIQPSKIANTYRPLILNPARSTAGYIGIGSRTPLTWLTVTGVSNTYTGSGTDGILTLTTGTGVGNDEQLAFGIVDGNYSWIQALKPGVAARQLILQPAGGGYVGICTKTPQINLAVTGASNAYANTGGGIFMITTGNGAGGDERMEMGILDGQYAWIQATKPGSAARNIVLNPVGGMVGVNGNPAYDFHVTKATTYTQAMIENVAGTGDTGLILKDANRQFKLGINVAATGAGGFNIFDLTAGNLRFSIASNGNVGIAMAGASYLLQLPADSAAKPTTSTWTVPSSRQVKQNIRDLEGGLDVITKLRPIEAEYNGAAGMPKGQRTVGFVAEEVQAILPDCVTAHKGKISPDAEEEIDLLGLNIHEILIHLILAVQQLAAAAQKA